MTKAELIEEVSRVSDLTKKHSEIIVDTVFKSIIKPSTERRSSQSAAHPPARVRKEEKP
jgi:nucleoid DNA-binding protein